MIKYADATGNSKSAMGWAKVAGVKYVTMHKRLRDLGWSVEKALSTPVIVPDGTASLAIRRARTKRLTAERIEATKTMLRLIKDRPCVDCGVKYVPDAMEFDHVPERGEKEFAISMPGGRRITEIMAEIAKCDLVCANCHRVRTIRRRQLEALNL